MYQMYYTAIVIDICDDFSFLVFHSHPCVWHLRLYIFHVYVPSCVYPPCVCLLMCPRVCVCPLMCMSSMCMSSMCMFPPHVSMCMCLRVYCSPLCTTLLCIFFEAIQILHVTTMNVLGSTTNINFLRGLV